MPLVRTRTVIRFLTVTNLLLSVLAAESEELKHPDWHADGRQLIAEGSCAGGIDLYLLDIESRAVRLLWGSEATDGYPRWFPDGKQIAFHQIDANRNSRIYVAEFSAAGAITTVEPVTEGPFDIEPSPSPNGNRLAYSRAGEHGQDIAIIDLLDGDDSRVWETRNQDNYPSWHPHGDAIIFHSRDAGGTRIFRRNLESGRMEVIMKSNGPDFVGHLSPDGRHLAYSSERDGDREIYVFNLADGGNQRLTNRIGRDGYPKFSPDGHKVAYHSSLSDYSVVIRVLDIENGDASEFSCAGWTRNPGENDPVR